MPLVRITLDNVTPATQRRAIADGVHEAMVAALGIPKADHFQIIDERPSESLIFDDGYLGVRRERVVFVQIFLVRGRTVDQKKALYRQIADNLSQAGVRPEDVFIQLTETGREDWSFGNGEAQALDTELLARYGWTPPAGS
jgi:phenylpyruvate tautomerase PptA (4-oxalocrotonate tautomerase family)